MTDKTTFGFQSGVRIAVDRRGVLDKIKPTSFPYFENIDQRFGWYEGHPGQNLWGLDRASGAYIFRPVKQTPHYPGNLNKAVLYEGPVVHEVHQQVVPQWLSQVIRTYGTDQDVEFEWLVGPIPISDSIGKEIITSYSCSDLKSSKTFYTDSNGRQMMRRERDYRPTWKLNETEPVSENYYPVNSRIALVDLETQFKQMTILTDRSQGGSSMNDGQVYQG